MPTSVLLAVLAAAGLLALAPALVRRYDATERLVAERALSNARVVARAGSACQRRRRTIPGRRPMNPPRTTVIRMLAGQPVPATVPASLPATVPAAGSQEQGPDAQEAQEPATGRRGQPKRSNRTRTTRAVYRRRRVLLALVILNLAELVGVIFVAPGFWVGEGVTGPLLGFYLVHLRNQAITEQRRRRAEARYAAWVAARQAAVRREQARRAAARRAALEEQFAERDRARREAARIAALRGRPYSTRAVGQ